ncbi:hypothetical protein C8R44DRAFT_725700 [Mycena epipterygia]|nr:hypothetical protein C8R44DRAFT_725700 [Mycena epipterygia]
MQEARDTVAELSQLKGAVGGHCGRKQVATWRRDSKRKGPDTKSQSLVEAAVGCPTRLVVGAVNMLELGAEGKPRNRTPPCSSDAHDKDKTRSSAYDAAGNLKLAVRGQMEAERDCGICEEVAWIYDPAATGLSPACAAPYALPSAPDADSKRRSRMPPSRSQSAERLAGLHVFPVVHVVGVLGLLLDFAVPRRYGERAEEISEAISYAVSIIAFIFVPGICIACRAIYEPPALPGGNTKLSRAPLACTWSESRSSSAHLANLNHTQLASQIKIKHYMLRRTYPPFTVYPSDSRKAIRRDVVVNRSTGTPGELLRKSCAELGLELYSVLTKTSSASLNEDTLIQLTLIKLHSHKKFVGWLEARKEERSNAANGTISGEELIIATSLWVAIVSLVSDSARWLQSRWTGADVLRRMFFRIINRGSRVISDVRCRRSMKAATIWRGSEKDGNDWALRIHKKPSRTSPKAGKPAMP